MDARNSRFPATGSAKCPTWTVFYDRVWRSLGIKITDSASAPGNLVNSYTASHFYDSILQEGRLIDTTLSPAIRIIASTQFVYPLRPALARSGHTGKIRRQPTRVKVRRRNFKLYYASFRFFLFFSSFRRKHHACALARN